MNLKFPKDVDTWIKEHGVRYFNDLQITTYRRSRRSSPIIARRYRTIKESDKNKDLGEELADVVL
jgi:hypothetical protein